MTHPSPPAASGGGGSTLRLIAGTTLLICAFAAGVTGFVRLTTVLDHGGYGTAPMRYALVILGVAGAMLSAGIATLIWDIAKRYER